MHRASLSCYSVIGSTVVFPVGLSCFPEPGRPTFVTLCDHSAPRASGIYLRGRSS